VSSYLFEEKPIILFDTHPGNATSFVQESWDRFRRHIGTAWTGVPYFDVSPGMLRLFWTTVCHPNACDKSTLIHSHQTDGKEGKRDYELREHEEVRQGFEVLASLNDVGRAMVLGYASQNPYVIFGESEFERQEKERKKILESTQYRDFVPRKRKENVGAEIDHILDMEEKKLVDSEHILDKQDV